MTSTHSPIQVGAPDPEANTSPIVEESDEEFFEVAAQEIEELPVCYYNNQTFQNGAFVCSGSAELLHCRSGLWVRQGGCDPDNP